MSIVRLPYQSTRGNSFVKTKTKSSKFQSMLLYSTKNKNNQASLQEAVMKGLPDDNGLYMPEHIPQLAPKFIQNLSQYSFLEIAQEVCTTLFGQTIQLADLKNIL